MSKDERDVLVLQMEQECYKKQKKGQMDDFKDKSAYVKEKKPTTADLKANSSTLWGEHEKNYLDDVTLDLIPDDDQIKNIKGKTAMKWDV
jgi:hypothetical protein